MTRLLAADLAPEVRVNAIAVGSMATSALEIVLTNDELRDAMVARHAAEAARRGRGHRRSRSSTSRPPPAGFVTGKVLEVDGGIEQPNLDMGLPDL